MTETNVEDPIEEPIETDTDQNLEEIVPLEEPLENVNPVESQFIEQPIEQTLEKKYQSLPDKNTREGRRLKFQIEYLRNVQEPLIATPKHIKSKKIRNNERLKTLSDFLSKNDPVLARFCNNDDDDDVEFIGNDLEDHVDKNDIENPGQVVQDFNCLSEVSMCSICEKQSRTKDIRIGVK